MSNSVNHVDIIIVGAGMVGASLAALLPETLSVAVIETHALPDVPLASYQPSYDARSTALSYQSKLIFAEADLWRYLQPYAETISDVHVSDKGHWGSTHLSAKQLGWPALGYVVENALLGQSLHHALAQKSNVTLFCPYRLTGIHVLADGVQVHCTHQQTTLSLHAQLLVVADGAQSDSCQLLGIEHQVQHYGHSAIVANVSTSKAHNGIAYERFTASGPIALLPQKSTPQHANRSALIWTLTNTEADSLLALSDSEFLQQLQQHFGHWQGDFTYVGKRNSYALKLSRAEEQIRRNIVILGNAAHSLHPVAGQGFNLALRDTKKLADLLVVAQQQGQALGDLRLLNRYLSQQTSDQYFTILFSDKLPSVFAQVSPLMQLARNLGLLGLDLMPSLKSSFTRFAAGFRPQVK